MKGMILNMDNKKKNPLEEELRSSQVYKTLTGVGEIVSDRIAEGLEKAAKSVDNAMNNFAAQQQNRTGGNGVQNGQNNSQYTNRAPNASPPNNNTQSRTSQGNSQQGGAYNAPRGAQGSVGYRAPSPVSPPPPMQTPPPIQSSRSVRAAQKAAAKQKAWQQKNQAGQQWAHGRANPAYNAAPVSSQTAKNPQQPAPAMKMVRKPGVAKYIVTGAACLMYSFSWPLYEPQHFLIFLGVGLTTFLVSSLIFKGKKTFVPVEPEPIKAAEPEKVSKTGNLEIDKIVEEGNDYMLKLRRANDAIPDEKLSDSLYRMEKSSSDIFKFIIDNPGKAPQIRTFMNYYLPTTLKLLASYQRMSKLAVKGENVTSTMFEIEGMMHTVADAFEKQLDTLFSDEAMDVSADITVFESMLKQEGFSDDKDAPSMKSSK